jgi:hypothetical protein
MLQYVKMYYKIFEMELRNNRYMPIQHIQNDHSEKIVFEKNQFPYFTRQYKINYVEPYSKGNIWNFALWYM